MTKIQFYTFSVDNLREFTPLPVAILSFTSRQNKFTIFEPTFAHLAARKATSHPLYQRGHEALAKLPAAPRGDAN